jgi:hypothetical protein
MAEPVSAAPPRRAVRLTLALSGDRRHVEIVRAVTARLADLAGVGRSDAERLGEDVSRGAGRLFAPSSAPDGQMIEVHYASDARTFTVTLSPDPAHGADTSHIEYRCDLPAADR